MSIKAAIIALSVSGTALGAGYAAYTGVFNGDDTAAPTTQTDNDGWRYSPEDIPQMAGPSPSEIAVPYMISQMGECAPLINQMAADDAPTGQNVRDCMNEVKAETRQLQDATMAQFAADGSIAAQSDSFALAASEISAIVNDDCAITETSFDGYMNQNRGSDGHVSVDTLLSNFYQDISTCLGTLADMSQPTTYTNQAGQERTLSATFTQSATPINQEWREIIEVYNAFLGAEIGQNPQADADFSGLATVMQRNLNR